VLSCCPGNLIGLSAMYKGVDFYSWYFIVSKVVTMKCKNQYYEVTKRSPAYKIDSWFRFPCIRAITWQNAIFSSAQAWRRKVPPHRREKAAARMAAVPPYARQKYRAIHPGQYPTWRQAGQSDYHHEWRTEHRLSYWARKRVVALKDLAYNLSRYAFGPK